MELPHELVIDVSNLRCEACKHPYTEVVGFQLDFADLYKVADEAARKHVSTTNLHRCLNPECGHTFFRAVD